MAKIKMCGMMRPADVINARDLGADYVGFVLTDGFKRSIGLGTFCELKGYLVGTETKSVGVFVDEPIENMLKYYAAMLDMIQLHGSEDNDYIRTLRLHTDKPIIKAFRITSEEDVQAAKDSIADYVLLDSGTGTGKAFDHSLIKDLDRDYFLAGGLTAENVAAAIEELSPFAVDVSTSLETEGRKDKKKMTAFVKAVRTKGQSL